MPLIHIELIEGRTQEQLKNLVADVTDAVTKILVLRQNTCTSF